MKNSSDPERRILFRNRVGLKAVPAKTAKQLRLMILGFKRSERIDQPSFFLKRTPHWFFHRRARWPHRCPVYPADPGLWPPVRPGFGAGRRRGGCPLRLRCRFWVNPHFPLFNPATVLVSSCWGGFLLSLGVRTFLSHPDGGSSSRRSNIAGDFLSTVFLTLTNPLTLLSFAAIFAGLGLGAAGETYIDAGGMVLGVFLGSALWWW
ncbi:MAG: LysE type translocator, partial [Deltaproteobacteria bacterium]|nr:LysE type translocator [Deltaproteobacteria bacterium]